MDLERAIDELYGLLPTAFTAARNAKAAEARKAGFADVAASLKELRKPSAGAWLANLLVRERSKEIESLLALGDGLREPGSKRGGDEIRKVSKQRVDAASKLIRHAKSRASHLGHPASASTVDELEMTLDAAFANPAGCGGTPAGSPHHRVAIFRTRVQRADRHRDACAQRAPGPLGTPRRGRSGSPPSATWTRPTAKPNKLMRKWRRRDTRSRRLRPN